MHSEAAHNNENPRSSKTPSTASGDSRATGPLELDGSPLSLDAVEQVARHSQQVVLATSAVALIEASRGVVEQAAAGESAVYGVNTGFGSLARQRISHEGVCEVQLNLIRSHAAGVGDPLPDDVVRAMLVCLAGSLARGCSGVRVELIEAVLALLNAGVTPVVPSRGSVGASGDLAPLAHAALVLLGEGEARVDGEVVRGGEALRRAKLTPVQLQAKEGLALINGTHLMTAVAALALRDIERIGEAAVIGAGMALDACRGTDAALDPRLHAARRQPGQMRVAKQLRDLLHGSQIIPSHRENDPRVQDPYCLRAAPQVTGAAFDLLEYCRSAIERELGAVTDNPLVFAALPTNEPGDRPLSPAPLPEGEGNAIISGGNFHGMPVAIPLDLMPIALAHLAGIAERRIYWLLAASDSENPIHVYLSPQPGLHSGMMIVQYTAAACCNELQTLCTAASVANIPTSAGVEDYNSMGATAAMQVMQAVKLARSVIAIELLVMCEALEYQRPLRSGGRIECAYEVVRGAVPRLIADRPPAPDIAAIEMLIKNGAFGSALR